MNAEKSSHKSALEFILAEVRRDKERFHELDMEPVREYIRRHMPAVLPAIHELYVGGYSEITDSIASEVLRHVPDKPSIDLIIRNDQNITRADMDDFPGYIEFIKTNPDPLAELVDEMIENESELKPLLFSDLSKPNTTGGSVDKEVLSSGFIRVQYPKSVWKNRKDMLKNSYIGRNEKIYLGSKMLWPADMNDEDIDRIKQVVRELDRGDFRPGVCKVGWREWTLAVVIDEDNAVVSVSPWWEKF